MTRVLACAGRSPRCHQEAYTARRSTAVYTACRPIYSGHALSQAHPELYSSLQLSTALQYTALQRSTLYSLYNIPQKFTRGDGPALSVTLLC